jgi:hypothetical protein
LIVVPRPLLAAPRRYLIVMLVDACGAARRASQVIDRGAQAASRSEARCALHVLDRGAQTASQGAARCASQVLDRGAQAAARGAATLSQQEKNNSAPRRR